MGDIFISYKRENRDTAEALAHALEDLGFSTWWDTRLQAGESFSEVIEEKLHVAKCVIVLWSEASVKSRWVRDEATEGLEKGIAGQEIHNFIAKAIAYTSTATDLKCWKHATEGGIEEGGVPINKKDLEVLEEIAKENELRRRLTHESMSERRKKVFEEATFLSECRHKVFEDVAAKESESTLTVSSFFSSNFSGQPNTSATPECNVALHSPLLSAYPTTTPAVEPNGSLSSPRPVLGQGLATAGLIGVGFGGVLSPRPPPLWTFPSDPPRPVLGQARKG